MLTKIRITEEGNLRAQLVEVGGGGPPHVALDDEPIVEVKFLMPLSDAKRIAALRLCLKS